MAAIIAGKPNPAALSEIDLNRSKGNCRKFRIQTIVFETAKRIYNSEKLGWKGSEGLFLAQIIRLVVGFIQSERLIIKDDLFSRDPLRHRVLLLLNINKIVQHICNGFRAENSEKVVPVFDSKNPIRSSGRMRTWYTGKPCEYTEKSHINYVVVDSTWETSEAFQLDKSENVDAWVKNDHLGFSILYNYRGVVREYYPDFIIRLKTGDFFILETKGQDMDVTRTK